MLQSRIAVSLLLVAGAVAQSPVLKDVNRLFPAFRGHSPIQAVGDVNGDGHRDVVSVGNVWLGSADSVFRGRADAFPSLPELVTAIALADLDGDGDVDCACACNPNGSTYPQPGSEGYDRILVNDGSGRFQLSPHGPLAAFGANTSIAAGDIDGDGDCDLVLGVPGSWPSITTNRVWVNNGTGQFVLDSQRLTTATPGTNALALFDQDGDGDLDLYCGNESPLPILGDQLFHNNGAGFFTLVPLATTGNRTLEVHARDFDGDGDIDVLTREWVSMSAQLLRYRRNDAGTFTSFVPSIPSPSGTIRQVVLGDWNADGLTDFAVRYADTLHLRVQTTPGQFAPSALPPLWTQDRAVISFDHDGDGDGDVIAPSTYTYGPYSTGIGAPESDWFRNLGTSWAPIPQPPVPSLPFGTGGRAKLADVDRDGDLDVVHSPHSGPGAIWLGNGAGSFAPMPTGALGAFATPLPSTSGDIAFGDVDGDGDVDIVCAVREQPAPAPATPSQLYRNTPNGLTVSPLPLRAEQAVPGDLDSDGDLDLVCSDFSTRAVLFNDGTGTFTPMALPAIAADFSRPLVLADFDGDLDLDIGIYTSGWPLQQRGFFANNGSGQFNAVPIPGTSGQAPHVAAADFDLDGDLDFVLDGNTLTPRQLLRNGGTGVFTVQTLGIVADPVLRWLRAADVDLDGWIDLIEIEGCGPPCGKPPSRILRNDQVGAFTALAASVVEPPYDVRDAETGDVDGDGDIDLMLASWHGTELYRNLQHQIAWRALPRVGHTLTLELFGRANEGCVLGLAFAPTAVPIPGLGTLRLEPASLMIIATGVYDINGTGVFVVNVPNDPTLVGLTAFWQALSVGSTLHLGNLETTTLAPR